VTADLSHVLVLSIYPCRRGFAYAVLEGTGRLVDWDVAQLGVDTDDEFRDRLQALIDKYQPHLVAFEDCSSGRRSEKSQARIEAGLGLAHYLDIRTTLISPGEVRNTLGLSLRATKHDVASHLARRFPELVRKTPKRTIWQRDARMNLFDAIALCLAAS